MRLSIHTIADFLIYRIVSFPGLPISGQSARGDVTDSITAFMPWDKERSRDGIRDAEAMNENGVLPKEDDGFRHYLNLKRIVVKMSIGDPG